jgi:hypothetical protein
MAAVRLLTLVACALVVGCGSGQPPIGSPAGLGESPVVSPAGGPPKVTGTVSAGPVCPVEQSPPDPACAPRPVAGAVIVATDAQGAEVGRATSLADGSYELAIGETGIVLISAMPVAGLVSAPAPVRVTLSGPGEVQRVDLEYDTGIR